MTQKEIMEDNTTSENNKYKDGVNRNARIIVRNISFKATEKALRDHFSAYGSVEEVNLLKKPDGRLVGCAFIHYTHVPMANKAIAATNKKMFLGRPIYVSWAVPKHKFGDQENENPPGKPEKRTEVIPDKKQPKETQEQKKNKLRVNRNARLIIRNVSFKATEESLKEHFEPYGTVLEVKLLKKPDGKLVGCAFVHFKNVPMAKKALLNTNMKPYLGRPISVDWAVAKDKYMQHMVNQQVEMQEKIKQEDSDEDSNDEKPPLNVSDEVKNEIKSESGESSNEDEKSSNKEDEDSDDEDSDDEDSDDEDSEDEGSEEQSSDEDENENELNVNMRDDASETSTVAERKRIQLNDAEDGCTVFATNIPFSIDNHLLKQFAERTGQVKYALICVDKLTEHSKGTGFIKFVNKEDADKFLALPANQLTLDGQVLQVKPALKRENLKKDDKKQAKDNRNLYLVKEGVIIAGTKAAEGVSASDMAKRLALERSKTQMLKNLNRFVSRYRLVVSNLPQQWDDARLRGTCARAAPRAVVTEARVMRDLRAPVGPDGRHPSKGYGFVMFMKHEDALTCLRKLNNNPDIFDKNNRPIVSFSIEDRTALNARKKRLEKSIANNPIIKKDDTGNIISGKRKNRKRKLQIPEESYVKKARFDNRNKPNRDIGKFVRRPIDDDEYTGLKSREGAQHKMRSNYKLKTQAEIHKQTVKNEKKKNRHSMRMKQARRERIKLPRQKVNKNPNKKKKKF